MWFKKKVKELKAVKEPKELNEIEFLVKELELLLKDLELYNISNLIEKAKGIAMQSGKEQLRKVLEYVKPFILKAVSEGKTNTRTEELPYKDYPYSLDDIDVNSLNLLKNAGIILVRRNIAEDFTQPLENGPYGLRRKWLPEDKWTSYLTVELREANK